MLIVSAIMFVYGAVLIKLGSTFNSLLQDATGIESAPQLGYPPDSVFSNLFSRLCWCDFLEIQNLCDLSETQNLCDLSETQNLCFSLAFITMSLENIKFF